MEHEWYYPSLVRQNGILVFAAKDSVKRDPHHSNFLQVSDPTVLRASLLIYAFFVNLVFFLFATLLTFTLNFVAALDFVAPLLFFAPAACLAFPLTPLAATAIL